MRSFLARNFSSQKRTISSYLPVYSVTVLPGPELISISSAVRGTSDGVRLMNLYKINWFFISASHHWILYIAMALRLFTLTNLFWVSFWGLWVGVQRFGKSWTTLRFEDYYSPPWLIGVLYLGQSAMRIETFKASGSNQDIRGLMALKINQIRLTKMACFSFLMNSLEFAVGFAAKFK